MAREGGDSYGLLDRSFMEKEKVNKNASSSRRYRPYVFAGMVLVLVIYITSKVTLYLRDQSEESSQGPPKTVSGEWKEDWKAVNEAAYKRMLKRRIRDFEDPSLVDTRTKALEYWTPAYSCPMEERIGTIRDGGKWVCNPTSLNKKSVVYSVGSRAEISFETDMRAVCNGCKIHTFDMTIPESKMKTIKEAEAKGILKFHPWGLGHVAEPENSIRPIQEIMNELGHKYIDVFKVDCEECEWLFFPSIFSKFPPVLFGQILVEVHNFNPPNSTALFSLFEEAGYRMFHYEVNLYSSRSIELCYIHESLIKP